MLSGNLGYIRFFRLSIIFNPRGDHWLNWGYAIPELFISVFANADRKSQYIWEADIIFFLFYFLFMG